MVDLGFLAMADWVGRICIFEEVEVDDGGMGRGLDLVGFVQRFYFLTYCFKNYEKKITCLILPDPSPNSPAPS